MKIHIENLGVLKQAEFELGDMTIICGGNNTGKTYATYALFGFLHNWAHRMDISIPDQQINDLLNNGTIRIHIAPYAKLQNSILKKACQRYTQDLPRIFASKENYFSNSKFQLELTCDRFKEAILSDYAQKVSSQKGQLFSLAKEKNERDLVVSLLFDKRKVELPRRLIQDVISKSLGEILFGPHFPDPFIASTERTGAAIFRRELDLARNRLLEEMGKSGKDLDPMDLFFKSYEVYALPVRVNVDFTRRLSEIAKKDSFLAKEHPEVLNRFSDIIGGEYSMTGSNDTVYFKPRGKYLKFTMDESSSAVRSLLAVGFYLRHIAKPGDLLIVDEPELNLHPENQRRITRLFARLVNLGVKVFITTHSDYIIKELNTLIMLHQDKPHLRKIARKEGFHSRELISPDKIKTYIAKKALIKLHGKTKRSRNDTLVKAIISPEHGIEAGSFDATIDEMNRIQDTIVWGEGS